MAQEGDHKGTTLLGYYVVSVPVFPPLAFLAFCLLALCFSLTTTLLMLPKLGLW
jgi:hypothetical protein